MKQAVPFLELKIPYFAKYSFKETVATHEPDLPSEALIKAYISIAKAISRFDPSLKNINLLINNELVTRVVDINSRGDYPTIAEAIRAANPGDTIHILPGLYRETLIIDKPINIIGKGDIGNIIIQSEGNNAIIFQTTSGHISNLSLRQLHKGKDEGFFCLDITQGSLELEGCDIVSEGLGGIIVRGGANPILRNNKIHDNKQ